MALLAIGLGIIVAGLGIGALLGALHERGAGPASIAVATSAPVVTPVPAATRAPIVIATIVPRHTPRPTPSPKATPSAAPSPTPRPSSAPSAVPTSHASAPPSRAPSALPSPVAATSKPTLKPLAVAATSPPTPLPATPRPATPRPTPVPTATPTVAPQGVAAVAASVVRRYIDALVRGDEVAGFAALGGAVGDRGLALSEESFLDPTARVTSIRVTPIDASTAKVECEISAIKGTYFATYQVSSGPRGPYISQHDFIKV